MIYYRRNIIIEIGVEYFTAASRKKPAKESSKLLVLK